MSSINTRRLSASLSSTSIPMPPPQSHTPSHASHLHHTPQQSNLLSTTDNTQPNRRNSTSQLSSSAPSFPSFLSNPRGSASSSSNLIENSNRSSTASNRNSTANLCSTMLAIDFDGGNQVIVRPNRIIRGKVLLNLSEKMHVTRIRVKFRAEEAAMVKIEEGGADGGKGEWIHEMITTFFETEWKLHGQEVSAYSQCGWEEVEPGHYEYPFALKFPNVNYPPSMEEPAGFGIRYIWTAQVDGAALQSGLKSREYITPYRPIIVSIADKEWVYKTTLMKDKKQALAEVQAKLYKQTYCPDEPFKMQLNMTTLQSDSKITSLVYRFRKHHEGKMLVQQGTAFKEHIRTVVQETVTLPPTDLTQLSETIQFDVPTRLVSPSFVSRHTRVHYDLCFEVTIDQGHLFKTSHVNEFAIPLTIANLPFDQLLRVPELTSIQHYRQSTECPLFFDPALEEPPAPQGLPSELIGPLTAALMSPNSSEEQPPSYFSLPELPPQFELRRERKERTVFMTRQARGAYHSAELGEATIIPGLFDEDW